MKQGIKKIITGLLVAAIIAAFAPQMSMAKSKTDCKSLCKIALKATGGTSKLKYSSDSADDFGALSYSNRKLVKEIKYVFDEKEAVSLCVMKAGSSSDAKKLASAMKSYKKSNTSSDYLSDYSKTEQKMFKSAIYGRKGSYVWYICMSTDKSVNKKGQSAIKKTL